MRAGDLARWWLTRFKSSRPDELRKIGRLAGIDNDQLEACLQDGTRAQTLVAWYQENAERDGIQATPSFIVNGNPVENQSYDGFKKLIEDELGS